MTAIPGLRAFEEGVRATLPDKAVWADPQALLAYTDNVGGFQRKVPLVVRPRALEEVLHVVRLANEHQVPLYPISRGRNWGLGSRLPVADGCVVVDLGDMRQVREVNEEFGYAVIEPGVTQGQLSEHLEATGSRFFLDVTGSGTTSSVIGNMLERGVGYNTLRADTLLALEVVLGNGSLLRTGYNHFPDCRTANLFPHGVGPSLNGLFFQSNYGIVTAATVKLLPRPAQTIAFFFKIAAPDLPAAVDGIREVKQQGIVPGVIHIGNRRRGLISLAPLIHDYYARKGIAITKDAIDAMLSRSITSDWTAFGHVSGDHRQCRLAVRLIRRALSPFGKLSFQSKRSITWIGWMARLLRLHRVAASVAAIERLFEVTCGKPTDDFLKSIHWPHVAAEQRFPEPDQNRAGLLFSVPAIPLKGASALAAVMAATATAVQCGFKVAITLNTLHSTCLEGVISIDFLKTRADEVIKAKRWLAEMHAGFRKLGIYPLRLDIDGMATVVDEKDVFWQTVREFKRALDPNNIIAPGRYELQV